MNHLAPVHLWGRTHEGPPTTVEACPTYSAAGVNATIEVSKECGAATSQAAHFLAAHRPAAGPHAAESLTNHQHHRARPSSSPTVGHVVDRSTR